MMPGLSRCAVVCALILAAITGAAQAQDDSGLSAAEIASKFNAQVAAQKTRGLVIAPSGGAVAEAPADDPAAVAATDATYVEVDPEAQVNIQISFDFDSAALRDSEKAKLTTLCQVIAGSEISLFRIVGHTDASGSDSYNQNLSQLRAEEVKRHLVGECGIAEARLQAVGVGEAFPFDAADPRSDANRRVEFQVGS